MKYFIIVLLFCLNVSTNVSAEEKIILGIGSLYKIPVKLGSAIHVANSKILTVQDSSTQLLVTAKKAGACAISVNHASYLFEVLDASDFDFYKALIDLTKTMMGLSVEVSDTLVYVRGSLLRFSDWRKIAELATARKADWMIEVKMSAEVEHEAHDYFQTKIAQAQLAMPTLVMQPQASALISKETANNKGRYRDILNYSGFKVEVDENSVNLMPVIEIAVQIAELKKSEFSKIGIQPPESVAANIGNSFALNVDPAQFAVTLNAMQSRGDAKVLANPRLICRSGREAHFLAGGEFPIKIFNFKMSDIQWKKHGIVLNIKPNADGNGRMSLYVYAEISLIDHTQVVDGVPGLLVNRVETYIDLSKSKTIALSGLVKQDWGKTRSGLPLFSDIPILNTLFSSEDFKNEQTDLVIFLTPRVLNETDG